MEPDAEFFEDTNEAFKRRLKQSIYGVIYDLVLNDDSIVDDGYFTRDYLIDNEKFIDTLHIGIVSSKVKFFWTATSREIILNILLRINHRVKTRKKKGAINQKFKAQDKALVVWSKQIERTIADLLMRLRGQVTTMEQYKN